jgi:hypothetical protein
MDDQIKIIEAFIAKAVSGLPVADTLAAVNAWNAFAHTAQKEHEALETIKKEQKAKGCQAEDYKEHG